MPNWCSNNFSITGNKNSISDLWVTASLKEGLLEAIKPIGEWEYGNAVEAWGTKWDVSLEGLEYTDHGDGTASIEGWFDSAWSPPIGAYEQLAADFDSCAVYATYFEPGMAFCGEWSSEGVDSEYEIDPEDLSDIPDHLREEYAIDDWYDSGEAEYEEDIVHEMDDSNDGES